MGFKGESLRDRVKSNISTSKMCRQDYREMIENTISAVNKRKEINLYVKCINKVYIERTSQTFKLIGVGTTPILGIKSCDRNLSYFVRQKTFNCEKKQG